MQISTLQFLADELKSLGVDVYLTRQERFRSSQLSKTPYAPLIKEVYQQLEGKDSCWNITVSLPHGLETAEVRLTVDDALHLNRYRAQSLQASFYHQEDQLKNRQWVEPYSRACRSAERDCLKDGSKMGIWSNPEAEKHFGAAQEAGDFFGTGAPGWRLNAFRDFLADVYLNQGTQQFKRLNTYDRLMIQGKLMPLQQLLQSRSGLNLPYLFRYLARQLGQPLALPGNL